MVSETSERVVLYEEGKQDPSPLNYRCSVCGAEPGMWCGVLHSTSDNMDRIGVVHQSRTPMERTI